MSDPSDRGSKPPRGPGSGASGSPGTIGKALGGDLDFEPDLLLDALTEEEARPTQRPPEPAPLPKEAKPSEAPEEPPRSQQPTIVDEHELEGDRPSFVDDEVTVVGQREFFEPNAFSWYLGTGNDNASLNHAWYIGFAPAENPQIAFAVMVEYGGSGGRSAARIASGIVEAAIEHGYLQPTRPTSAAGAQ